MAFIDEVNAVDLGQRVRAKVPLVAVGFLAAALVAGFAMFGALQPPVAVVGTASDEQQVASDGPIEKQGVEVPSESAAASEEESPVDAAASPETIVVHVGGCVAMPGVYRVASDARLDDAVSVAGGMTAEAAADAVNLAAHLEDGQQVLVPSCEQVAEGQWALSPSGATAMIPGTGDALGGAGAAPLNVNQATVEQLTQLSGIGDALAQRIVADRDKNGPFASVDDLVRVSGIGKKKLDGFREDVCV